MLNQYICTADTITKIRLPVFTLFLLSVYAANALFVAAVAFVVIAMLSKKLTNPFQHPSNRLAWDSYADQPYPGTRNPKPKATKPAKPKGNFHPMALVKYAGTGAMAISGKIGGTVFTNGGFMGPFVRNWAKPKNGRTALQVFVRGLLSGISTSWRTLTAAQITAWNEAASGDGGLNLRKNVFGDTKKVSGIDLFQRINNNVLIAGGTVYATPPVAGATDAILSAVPTFAAGTPQADLLITTFGGATTIPANTNIVVYATSQKGSGRRYFGASQYRLLAVYSNPTAINPLNILAAYNAMFGTLVAGSNIGLRAHFWFDDGAGIVSKGGDVYATATVAP